jgi:hypothetical protein
MKPSPQHLSGFIDLLVEAVLRDIEAQKNADESGQEQRRRDGSTLEKLQAKTPEVHTIR